MFRAACLFVASVLALNLQRAHAAKALDLTSSSKFESALQSNDAVFVKFYAPWCGHCKDLQPTWDKLADLLSSEAGVVVAKVDATQDKAAARRFGVTSYPALRLIRGNKVYEHAGSRSLHALESFVRTGYNSAPSASLPALKADTADAATSAVVDLTASTPSQFDAAVAEASSGIMLEFFAPWCGHCKSLAPEYDVAAAELQEDGVVLAKVDATQNKEQAERFGVRGYPTLIWVFGGQLFRYSGARKASDLIAFAKGGFEAAADDAADYSALPALEDDSEADDSSGESAVQVLTDATFEHLTQAATGATTGPWFVKFYAPWCGHCKKMAPQWEKTARALKGRVNVAEVDCTQHRATCSRFDVQGYPSIQYIEGGRVWQYKGGRTAARMQRWAEIERLAPDSDAPTPVPAEPSLGDSLLGAFQKAGGDLAAMLRAQPVPSTILAAIAFVAGLFTMMIIVLLTEAPREQAAPAEQATVLQSPILATDAAGAPTAGAAGAEARGLNESKKDK